MRAENIYSRYSSRDGVWAWSLQELVTPLWYRVWRVQVSVAPTTASLLNCVRAQNAQRARLSSLAETCGTVRDNCDVLIVPAALIDVAGGPLHQK